MISFSLFDLFPYERLYSKHYPAALVNISMPLVATGNTAKRWVSYKLANVEYVVLFFVIVPTQIFYLLRVLKENMNT